MDNYKWIDILTDEHDIIQRALDVFQRELDRVINNKHQTRVLYCIIDFLITFGSEIHNRKEDEILFPILASNSSIDSHQIHITTLEHNTGRDILLSLFDEIEDLKKRTKTYRKVYKQKGADYIKNRFEHIWKENDVIYNLAREIINDKQNSEIILFFQM